MGWGRRGRGGRLGKIYRPGEGQVLGKVLWICVIVCYLKGHSVNLLGGREGLRFGQFCSGYSSDTAVCPPAPTEQQVRKWGTNWSFQGNHTEKDCKLRNTWKPRPFLRRSFRVRWPSGPAELMNYGAFKKVSLEQVVSLPRYLRLIVSPKCSTFNCRKTVMYQDEPSRGEWSLNYLCLQH